MLLDSTVQHDFVGFSLTCGMAQEALFRPALRAARPRSRSRNFGGWFRLENPLVISQKACALVSEAHLSVWEQSSWKKSSYRFLF